MKRKYLNFCKVELFFLVFVGIMFIFNVKVWAGTLISISSAVYDGGSNDCATGVAIDGNNDIIVTGYRDSGANNDYYTIKYNSNLVVITSAVYDGGNNDQPYEVLITENNNIIVGGGSTLTFAEDYFTIKYDNNLSTILASATYNGPGNNSDFVFGIIEDGAENIIVTGERWNGANWGYFTIKYDSNLVVITSAAYDTSNHDSARGVTIDGNNNIIVTGRSNNGTNDDYYTIKYDNDLVIITSVTYDRGSNDSARGVTIDGSNNIIVTGESNNGANFDYFTIKYDSNLVVITSAIYDGGGNDYVYGILTHGNNNIIVTGGSWNGASFDYFTIKYDSNLVVIASATYDGGNSRSAQGVMTDDNNNIIVTGYSHNGANYDYFTIKYLGSPQVFSLSPFFASPGETVDITINGLNFYNGIDVAFSNFGILVNSIDFISATQLRANITIDDNAFSGTRDITVTNIDDAYGMLTSGFEIRENIGFQEEEDSHFVRLTPKIITPNGDGINDAANFIFTNPDNETAEGMIFDLSGSVVRDNLPSSSTTSLTWDGRDSSGCVVSGKVYIYQIKIGGKVFNGTVVVAK